MKTLLILAAFAALTSPAVACEVTQKRPVQNCPAVAYSPDDCLPDLVGKAGDRVTSPATAHVMESGFVYYCPSHEGCIQMKDLNFKGCKLKYVSRQRGESKEYKGHIVVE